MPSWTPYSLNPSQTFDLTNASGAAPSGVQGLQVGSNLYYVTEAEQGSPSGGQATRNIWIQKSTDGGHTWSLVYNGPLGVFGHASALSGSIIYIFCQNANVANVHLWLFRFDTSTDSMVDSGTDFGFNVGTTFTATAFNDGKILLAYDDQNTIFDDAVLLYDPGANTVSSPVSLNSSGANLGGIVWQVHDPATNLVIVGISGNSFVSLGASSSVTKGVAAAVVDESLTVQPLVLAQLFPGNDAFGTDLTSTAAISGGTIYTCYRNYSAGGFPPNNISVTFSTIGTSLSFNWASQEDLATLNGSPNLAWIFENEELYGWGIAADGSGTIYAFYTVNISFNDNSGSQTMIWYQTRLGPGSWSAPVVMWTGPTPSSGMSLYPFTLASGDIAMWASYVDPVLYFGSGANDEYDSLTVLFFAPNVAPAAQAYIGKKLTQALPFIV